MRTSFRGDTTQKEAAARAIEDERPEMHRFVQLKVTKGTRRPPNVFVDPVERQLRRAHFRRGGPRLRTDGGWATHTQAFHALWQVGNGAGVRAGAWRAKCVAAGVIRARTERAQTDALQRIARKLTDHGLTRQTGRGPATSYTPLQAAGRTAELFTPAAAEASEEVANGD